MSINIDRIFAEMDVMMTEDMIPRQNDYLQILQDHPPPWAALQKAIFKAQLQRLQGDLDKWNEFIETVQSKANRMQDAGKQAALYFRVDSWKRQHKVVIDKITMILLEGNAFMELNVETQVVNPPITQETNNAWKIPRLNIQKFDGNYLNYNSFWQRFKYLVHDRTYPTVEKLITLYGLLEGKALKAVEGFQMAEENYDTVIGILAERFGNENMILQELHAKLRSIPRANPSAGSMRNTVDSINKICRELQNFGVNIDNDSTRLDIIGKMPSKEKDKLTLMNLSNPRPSTDEILQKMSNMVLKAEVSSKNRYLENVQQPSSYPQHLFNQQKRFDTTTTPPSSSSSNTEIAENNSTKGKSENNSSKMFACSLCEEAHSTARCPQFVTVDEKLKQLKLKHCCTNCARRNHVANQCHATVQCRICNENHYAFLCPSKNNTNFQQQAATKSMISLGAQQGCLLTKMVTVMNPRTKETVDATILFDPGSQRSFVSENLIRQLKLPIEAKEQLHLEGIGAKAANYKSSIIKLQIKTTENYQDIQANSIRKIANSVPVINFEVNDITNYTVTEATPDILIGIDYFFTFITSFEKRNDMVIVHSTIGQMLSGNITTPQRKTISSLAIKQKKLDCDTLNLSAMGKQDVQKIVTAKQNLKKFKKLTSTKAEHGIYSPHSNIHVSRSTKDLIETKHHHTIPNVGRGRTFYNTSYEAKRKRASTVSFPHRQKLMFPQQLADVKTEQCHGQRSLALLSPQTKVKPHFYQARHETKTAKDILKLQKVECQLECFPSSKPSSSVGGEDPADLQCSKQI